MRKITFYLLGLLILGVFLGILKSDQKNLKKEVVAQNVSSSPTTGNISLLSYYMPQRTSLVPFWLKWDRYNRVLPDRQKRIPLLGYYLQTPEVINWHIKWSLQHGIKYWIFDEYWAVGQNTPLSTLPGVDSFLKSPQNPMIKFAVMLTIDDAANARGKNPAEAEAFFRRIIQFWEGNYFNKPNYLKVEGKPLIVFWKPLEVVSALSGWEKFADIFPASKYYILTATNPGDSLKTFSDYGISGYAPYGTCSNRPLDTHPSYREYVEGCREKWPAVATKIKDFNSKYGRSFKFLPSFIDQLLKDEPDDNYYTTNVALEDYSLLLTYLKDFIGNEEFQSVFLDIAGKRAVVTVHDFDHGRIPRAFDPGKTPMSPDDWFGTMDVIYKAFVDNPVYPHSHDAPKPGSFTSPWPTKSFWDFEPGSQEEKELFPAVTSTDAQIVNFNGKSVAKIRANSKFNVYLATKINASEFSKIKIKMGVSCFKTSQCPTRMTVAWWSDKYNTGNFYPDRGMIRFDFDPTTPDLKEYELNVIGVEKWEGTIEGLEFAVLLPDTSGKSPVEFFIDSIEVVEREPFFLSQGWNQITWPDIQNYTAKSALEDIDNDCGTGTVVAIARKRKDWWEDYVKNYGGQNFALNAGNSYYINVTKDCPWNP